MNKFRLYTLLVLMMMICDTASAYDFEAVCSTGQTLYYNINIDSISVSVTYPNYDGSYSYYSGYPQPEGDIVIPNSVVYQGNEYTVTDIGTHAFCRCNQMGTVTLPTSLITIGYEAFRDSNINGHLVIPDSVISIGQEAFSGVSSLNELTIGASVKSLGLWSLNLYDLRTFHYNAIDCDDLEYHPFGISTRVTSLTIGEEVLYIPQRLFQSTNHFECDVVIPNSVVRIGEEAFFDSRVSSVVIGDGVVEIGVSAFYNNHSLTSLKLGKGLKTIKDSAFMNCGIAGHLVLPDSLEIIESAAFHCCDIDTLTIGTSMDSIGWSAFSHNNFGVIYVKTVIPPYIGFQYFSTNQYSEIEVHVPCESLCDYLNDENWSIFPNITASFPYHLNVESADLQMGTASITGVPNCCDNAIVKAYPRQDFEFDRWETNGSTVSQDETYTFQLEQDMTLVAYFKIYDGIEEDYNNNSIVNVYPNPTRDRVVIEGMEAVEVKVYNTSGQMVKCVRGTNEIDVEGLAEGIYLLRIMDSDGKIYTNKIMKR